MSSQDPTLQFSLCEQKNLKLSVLTFPFARMNPRNSLTQLHYLVTRINRYEWNQIYSYKNKSNDLRQLRARLEELDMDPTPNTLDDVFEVEEDVGDDDRIHELIEEEEIDDLDEDVQERRLRDSEDYDELSESELEIWRSTS